MTKEKQNQKAKQKSELDVLATILIDPETSDIYIDNNDVPLLDFIRAISLMEAYAIREIDTINDKDLPNSIILEKLKSQFKVTIKDVV